MSEWRSVKLEAIADVIDSLHQTPVYSDVGYPMIRVTDIKKGRLDLSNTFKVTKEVFEKFSKNHLPKKGDLVFSRVGSYGNISYVDTNDDFCLGQNTAFIIPKQSSLFLYYFLNSPLGINEIESSVAGSTQPTVSLKSIKNFEIPLPPLPEQKAIASVLSSLDDKIDLLHRQNKTLEAMAETLFRQWFDEKDCNGTVSQLISIQNGYAFKSKDFNEQGNHSILKIKNISASIVDIERTDFISTNIAGNIPERFKVRTGDILIAMTGAEIGKLGIVPRTNKTLWLNQRVGLLSEKHKGAKYLAYIQLKSEFGQDYIQNTAAGSAQPNISGTGIENCGFPLVSDDEIKNYSEEIDSFYEKLIFNLGQIRTLETLRDTLLPKLMSGEVRVDYP